MTNHETVSFDDELLICVDERDNVVGYKTKAECHAGAGILHRAFSIFIFTSDNRLLVQQRSPEKELWDHYWSNSCCSHPRKGETSDQAARRRLEEELGLETDLRYLYKFHYQVPYGDKGSEHEICSVFVGRSDESPTVNPHEIADWRYLDLDTIDHEFSAHSEQYTPWFKMEWARIRSSYQDVLKSVPETPHTPQ